jgi:hypothetical protein
MSFKNLASTVAAVLMVAALTSCGPRATPAPTVDANAIYTSAANTLAAGLAAGETQTAKAVTPTSATSAAPLATFSIATGSSPFGTPLAGGTPFNSILTPGAGTTPLAINTQSGGGSASGAVGCNNATFVGETDPMDKTQIASGKNFTKGWSMQNTGTCTWGAGYSWAFVSGDQMAGKDITITSKDAATSPGHSNTFIVKLTAPTSAGEYKGFWRMKAPDGTFFGDMPWVDIVVP